MSPDPNHLATGSAHLLYGFGAAALTTWAMVAIVVTANLAVGMFDSDGSILFIPWKQKWTWVYALVVLPMGPLYIVAAIRVTIDTVGRSRTKTAPNT